MPLPPRSPATDIAEMLETDSYGTVGQDLFVGREPETDDIGDITTTLYDTGASEDPEPHLSRDYPTIQVRVRGKPQDYDNAWAKAQAAKELLLGSDTRIINDTNYVGFWMVGDIISLGYDARDRLRLVSNWRLVREYDASGHRNSMC